MGYGDVRDVLADVQYRWGEGVFDRLAGDLATDPQVSRWERPVEQLNASEKVVFHHVPEPLYLDYLEEAFEQYVLDRSIVDDPAMIEFMEDPRAAPLDYLNGLFARRQINYRFTEDGRAEWHGDEGAYRQIIRPALNALDDDRLDGCRDEFEAALGHLRAGTAKDREDAIEEAGKAVESAMKVVLAARGVERTGNETAEPLWNLLRANDIVPAKTKDAILAPSRLRNEYGGHGAGEAVREIPEGIPELAVRSAAGAVAYLAARLP